MSNDNQTIVLLRVGIDYGYGFHSPVFRDNTYQYIPIYYKNKKEQERHEKRTYKDLIGFNNKCLAEYLPHNLRNKVVHYDPEFETFSYGEVSNPKRGALLKLKHGDILAFYFGSKVDAELGCYIFGYFEINKIYEWKSGNDDINEEIIRVCKNNAHIISSKSKKNLVIIKGSNRSKLLQKCVKFTQTNRKSNNPPYVTIKSFREKYGIREYVHRAVPIHIKEQVHINNFKDLLNIDF